MSLKKFISIQGVGRLAQCVQKGPELKRLNLIFAENGRGKTTLCAVLRSLETGRHEHITERKTISAAPIQQLVTVRLDGGEARFAKNVWNTHVPNIAIFDGTFVAQNVHAGEYVTRDHRTNLLRVIVGDVGVQLAKDIDQLDGEIRDKNAELLSVRKQIEATLPTNVNLDAYLKIAEDADVVSKIAAKQAELNTAKQSDAVFKKAAPIKALAPALPENLFATLSKTLEDVSAEAEGKIKVHIADHKMGARGEAWISEGLGFTNGDSCPFCAQNTTSIPLVKAYRQYFSDAYHGLIVEIDKLDSDVKMALGDAAIAELGRVLALNATTFEFWEQHVPVGVNEPDVDALRNELSAQRTVLLEAIERKKATPLDAVTQSNELQKAVAAVMGILKEYNAQIDVLVLAIASKKIAVGKSNVSVLEGELAKLRLSQQRHEQKGKGFCTEYENLRKQKAELDDKKSKAKEKLDAHADQTIPKYEKKINEFLSGFGAGFSVVNTKKSYVGGTATSGYQLRINTQAIHLGDGSTPIGTPCFRTTVSAGDKSALALAFFLARLELDPNKSQKIVVFDDPFNSQDRSRRERTAELLKKYGGECKQLILFSHDPMFLHLVYSKLPKADRHCLQMSRVPDNFTTMEEWDIEKETQDGYFKDHAALNSYMLNGATDLRATVRRIRPVLEGYMRYRFPNQFPPDKWLGDMISHVRNEGSKHPMHPALAELEGINDYSKKFHHDSNPGKADSEILDDGELRQFTRRTLELAGGY